MDRKEIQQQRMRGYFIEAAKKVVKEEGVNNLTVKKVANLAGYAAATLYNYFEDLNELLFYCIVDFFDDCKEELLEEAKKYNNPKEKAINLAKVYAKFFIENPNIYQLLFLEDLGVPPKEIIGENYVPEVVKLSAKNLEEYAKEEEISKEDVEILLGLMANSIHGNLLFFIKRRGVNMTKEEVIEKIIREVEYVLEN
ncbi:TetR/AcrR family transcriptional regulator [Natroniella acetigena]|uniref:TetR/AcrR family transcriptional regulator n=1 Tax=Natroniella acetigena TaxID=52004 RepID=UPI00200A5FD3|nr:TetR/AcrR family transcriptional regulator [Natroniella acetigena]MCK8827667.1 TetR/AcrR family transcriptional regulator [Natroniella acetigena]